MFTPQIFLNLSTLFQQSETVKIKKCNRSKTSILLKSSHRGLRQPGRTRPIMDPYPSWWANSSEQNTDPRHRWPPLDPNTCTETQHCWCTSPAIATSMSSTVGELQNTGKVKAPPQKSSSSSAEGWGLSCTQEQQEGWHSCPSAWTGVASYHNNVLVVY